MQIIEENKKQTRYSQKIKFKHWQAYEMIFNVSK